MANAEHVKIVRQGAAAIAKWRQEHPGERPNLSWAYLSGADLKGAYLSRADLSGANLSGADLSWAYLSGADLKGAYLNWQSHDLIAELLRQAANVDPFRRAIAGLVLVSPDWCWNDFRRIAAQPPFDAEAEWAIGELDAAWDAQPTKVGKRPWEKEIADALV